MTCLVHLTDLHFGLHRDELVGPLRDAILLNRPDIVVVSGDLTQRARPSQFRDCMAFLQKLALPVIAVPGNHDIPLFNPLARLFNPFGRYRRGAASDLTPTIEIGRLRIFGANTADPFSWRGGVARRDGIDRICELLREGPADVTNILVCHHPLEEPPGFQRAETRGACAALGRLAEAGLHVTLSGHLHHWTAGLGITDKTTRPVFQMQTGTALCNRVRERNHGFAVMDFDTDWLSVTPWIVSEATLTFEPSVTSRYASRSGGWHATR